MPRAQAKVKHNKVKTAVRNLLSALEFDLHHPDLVETPDRVARMLISEVDGDAEELSKIYKPFPSDHDSMVTLVDHRTFTRCPHHLMPAELDITVAYIPNGKLLGLSKLARIADYYAKGFMLQEEIASGIADGLQDALQPLGVAVYIEGRHTCMRARGVETTHSTACTSVVRGMFKEDEKTRSEFFNIIRIAREGRG